MGALKIFGWVLKIPLIILNLATLGVGIAAAMGYIPGFLISWAAPAIIGGLQLAYIIGTVMIGSARKKQKNNMAEQIQEQSTQTYPEQDIPEQYYPEQNTTN